MSLLAIQQTPFGAHQLEPIQQLAPYLSGLNVTEALDGFTKLADKILTSGEQQADVELLADSSFYLRIDSPGGLSCSDSQWLSPFSSDSSTRSCPSSTGFSSGANSPAPSDTCPSSSSSSCSSPCGSSSRRRNRRAPSDSRRRNNATAAERYRQRLKGRKSGLGEQLDEQLERNQRLRRQVEGKLTLYKEFVALLARQTHREDRELANLGCKSLSLVLSELAASPGLHVDVEQRRELLDHLQHFQSVLSVASPVDQVGLPPQRQQRQRIDKENDYDDSQLLEYDFFADRFSLVGRPAT